MNNRAIEILKLNNQSHILDKLNTASESEKEVLSNQILSLENSYPGGIKEYINRAKKLLEDSKNNVNPYLSYKPSIPEGININVNDDEFHRLEEIGLENLAYTGFVLVAGGLGERLGYPGIKINIPIELLTLQVYLEYYICYLLAYQKRLSVRLNKEVSIPLCIMTSDDTLKSTEEILNKNNNFGLKEVIIVKQEKVPALLNNDCHISINNNMTIDTKPHGHGDVHTLLYQKDVIKNWVNNGKKYVVFFQDTNALAFKAVPSLVGVSVDKKFVVNTMTIPRKPGDAMGAICALTKDDKTITLNVEYNQLDSVLKANYNKDGDVANEKGLSDFPGNTNVLVFELNSYFDNLNKTKGLVPEFVNPKYADSNKTIFKSATRLECMMQDYPLLLTNNERVGFTSYPAWFAFASCKNNINDALIRLEKGLSPECGFSVEQNIFNYHIKILKLFNKIKIVKEENKQKISIGNSIIEFGPKIVALPSFAVTLREFNEKIKGVITITANSSLVLYENAVVSNDICIDGSLFLKNEIKENYEKADYTYYEALKENEGELYEQIRGYKIKKN